MKGRVHVWAEFGSVPTVLGRDSPNECGKDIEYSSRPVGGRGVGGGVDNVRCGGHAEVQSSVCCPAWRFGRVGVHVVGVDFVEESVDFVGVVRVFPNPGRDGRAR